MRDPAHPDREVIARLELPLPVDVVAAVGEALDKALRRLGYRDVVLLTDGTSRIAATPPGQPPSGPPPAEEGAPTAR